MKRLSNHLMKFSRGSRSLGMVLVGLFLLPVLVFAWCIPCHADAHMCGGDCTHSECCGCHSMPLTFAANAAPMIKDYNSPYHSVEEQPLLKIFASIIFHPPRV